MNVQKLPPLPKTAAAIAAYDAYNDGLDFSKLNIPDSEKAWAELERLGEAVGAAFGEETADRNNPDDCRRLIRPGHKVPGPGYELSFVRRMVALSESQS